MKIIHHGIHNAVDRRLDEVIDKCDLSIDREDLIRSLDEACDDAWRELVKDKCIAHYIYDDLVRTASQCVAIIEFAGTRAWVEDDAGLWDGLVYGVLATIAYNSLRNCFYQILKDRGIDSNNDKPLQHQ